MQNFEKLYNRHKGETCVIIGNGPSLKDTPRKLLEKYPTFGANKIYLLDGFSPDYYVSVNPLVIAQNINEIMALDCVKFLKEGIEGAYPLHSMALPAFSYAPPRYVYEGHTVTFVSMQLAFFMGFTTALLVGVDHRFTFDGDPNEQRHMEGDDPNHFSPEYFKGQEWNNPDLERSEHAYGLAKRAYEDDGRKIINLTPNSALDMFEKGKVRKWS